MDVGGSLKRNGSSLHPAYHEASALKQEERRGEVRTMGEKRHTSCTTLVAVIVVVKWRESISAALRLRIILTGRMLIFTVVYILNWCQLGFHRDGPSKDLLSTATYHRIYTFPAKRTCKLRARHAQTCLRLISVMFASRFWLLSEVADTYFRESSRYGAVSIFPMRFTRWPEMERVWRMFARSRSCTACVEEL